MEGNGLRHYVIPEFYHLEMLSRVPGIQSLVPLDIEQEELERNKECVQRSERDANLV